VLHNNYRGVGEGRVRGGGRDEISFYNSMGVAMWARCWLWLCLSMFCCSVDTGTAVSSGVAILVGEGNVGLSVLPVSDHITEMVPLKTPFMSIGSMLRIMCQVVQHLGTRLINLFLSHIPR
jgi:hypothetical protein